MDNKTLGVLYFAGMLLNRCKEKGVCFWHACLCDLYTYGPVQKSVSGQYEIVSIEGYPENSWAFYRTLHYSPWIPKGTVYAMCKQCIGEIAPMVMPVHYNDQVDSIEVRMNIPWTPLWKR